MKASFATTISLITLLLALPMCKVFSQDRQKESAAPTFQLVDADLDSNGKVTTEEMKKFLTDRYVEAWANKIDANGNGEISKWEFKLAGKALEKLLAEENKSTAFARETAKNKMPTTMIEGMNENFRTKKPLIGSTIESLIAFNESGEEVDFNSLRGKHVVVVFGCLT